MGKATGRKPRQDLRGPLQRLADNARIAAKQSELDVITPELRAKGTCTGQRSTIVNNHDPVERWKAAQKLTQSQQVVIEMCQRLWNLAGLQQRVTGSYGERISGTACTEARAINEIEAREDLHRIQDYVPPQYWSIFELVCRWGEAAGIAGGEGDRNGAHKAYVVVCLVADVIAMRERV